MIKRETFIQLIRIISMFSIIACHLVKNHIIGQFLTFGIYSFLFISGYLYCNKNIDKAGKWLVKQYKKITIPVFIYIIFLVVVYIVIKKQFNWYLIPIYLLNLQIIITHILKYPKCKGTNRVSVSETANVPICSSRTIPFGDHRGEA